MFLNYWKIALRHIMGNKLYSILNILGYAIGIAAFLVILMYVNDELSYDQFHDKGERIFRMNRYTETPDGIKKAANTAAAPGPTLVQEFPQVESTVRFMFPYPNNVLMKYGEEKFYEPGMLWADSTVFDVFSFPLLKGNPRKVLTEPFTLVISESMAEKYFGDNDPLGEVITISGWSTNDYKITGVMKDIPENSHLQFDFLGSMAGETTLYTFLFGRGKWVNHLFYTYALLKEPAAASNLNEQMADFAQRHYGKEAAEKGFKPSFQLQPLHDIHLHADYGNASEAGGDWQYIYLFSAVAVLILLIACINFINLTTAQSAKRAMEVGVRKILGAEKSKLIAQFLGESILLTTLSCVLALFLIESFLPFVNDVSGKNLTFSYTPGWKEIVGFLGLIIGIGVLSGAYPAFFLSNFKPVKTLKARGLSGGKDSWLQQGLVVFQFAVSTVMVIGALVIQDQMNFIQNQDLGFDKEQLVVLPMRSDDDLKPEQFELIKNRMLDFPGVEKASFATGTPGNWMMIDRWPVSLEGANATAKSQMIVIGADYDYLSTMGIELLEGRNFSKDFSTDLTDAFIINESAARTLGLGEEVLDQRIFFDEGAGKAGRIIGIVKDFHLRSLHRETGPVVLHLWPERYACMVAKVETDQMASSLQHIEEVWEDYTPETPFEYTFVDEEYDRYYDADRRLGKIFTSFSMLAIIISCLGLFGLATLMTEQKTREIGIRKVLGASVTDIAKLFLSRFSKWVLIGFLISLPFAWMGAEDWLSGFSLSVGINLNVFLIAGGLVFAIAWLTVGYHAIKTARANPVEALRDL